VASAVRAVQDGDLRGLWGRRPGVGVIGLYKTEEIHRRGPWRSVEDVEFATLEWVAWYNTRRLLEPLGYASPDEFERAYCNRQTASAESAVLT
jgi:transposase InsO family protein